MLTVAQIRDVMEDTTELRVRGALPARLESVFPEILLDALMMRL